MTTGTMRRELTIRHTVKKDDARQAVTVGRRVGTPKERAEAFAAVLQNQPSEVFAILCLSTKHLVIGYHEVSRGTLDTALVHPREVFKAAILANAAAIILTHNHSSGDPTPSADNLALTQRLVEAGRLLGIDVLDHIVIGDGTGPASWSSVASNTAGSKCSPRLTGGSCRHE
jgi:DNA repair protein RadC